MVEKRTRPRTRIDIPAHIVADRNTEHCTIVDMSDGGARLHVGSRLIVPTSLSLRAPDIGMVLAGQVVWRSKTQVGVRF